MTSRQSRDVSAFRVSAERWGLLHGETVEGGDCVSVSTCWSWALTVSRTLLGTEPSQRQCQGNCWKLPVIWEKCHGALNARWPLMKVEKVHPQQWSPIPYSGLSFSLLWMQKRTNPEIHLILALQNPQYLLLFQWGARGRGKGNLLYSRSAKSPMGWAGSCWVWPFLSYLSFPLTTRHDGPRKTLSICLPRLNFLWYTCTSWKRKKRMLSWKQ